MKKKIAQYLPTVFALIALVMLLVIGAGNDAPSETEPAATTEPTAQTTEPAATTEAPAETHQQTDGTMPQDARPLVEAALNKYAIDKTNTASCLFDGELHENANTTGAGKAACAYALADLCDERQMNPIAAFWLLVEESVYRCEACVETPIQVTPFEVPAQLRKEYPFTAEGTQELLTDVLMLSSGIGGGMKMDSQILGVNDKVDSFQVFYSEEEDCYSSYFVLYCKRSAHFLCFYTRGDELIDDLEFQLLNLRYAEGDGEALTEIDQLGDRQAATIMAAAELLLAGTSRANMGDIPMGYTCDGVQVFIERYDITRAGETGTLTNYDLHVVQ